MFGARLANEVKKARTESDASFFVEPQSVNNMQAWRGYILGPPDSPYEEGSFMIRITITSINFLTKIYHPNIHWESGEVCLDILKSEWSSKWSLTRIGKALASLMFDPNAESPLNCDAGNMIRAGDMVGFQSTARMVTRACAIPKEEHLKIFQEANQDIK